MNLNRATEVEIILIRKSLIFVSRSYKISLSTNYFVFRFILFVLQYSTIHFKLNIERKLKNCTLSFFNSNLNIVSYISNN